MMRTIRRATALSLLCGWLLVGASTAAARPAHKRALADYLGPHLATKLNDCRTCHLPDPPGAAHDPPSEKPHNPFGARLKVVRGELRQAGKKTTIADRLDAVADEDSDGDGVPNLIELLSGHFPGDAGDKPTAAELAEVRKTQTAFEEFQKAYPWRPFEPVQRPPIHAVKNTVWAHNPIDTFIAAEHEARGLRPLPEAPRPVLLRRLHLDLTGLPPTPQELHAFLNDSSPDAYEQVVDRLLADPRYGERWGRHWMDVWRYSDWAGWGQQVRDSQPHIWHWRDWIVENLNKDRGYDQMLVAMLAADETTPEDQGELRATGYLVRNYKLLSREKWMQDVVDHTAQAFLGVTLGCARCHDHMYDPITQKEYYQVRAVFEPHQVRTDRLPGELDIKKAGLPRAYDNDSQAKTYLFIRGDDRTPDKTPLMPGVPEALGGTFPEVKPVALPWLAHLPDKRPSVIADLRKAAAEEARKAQGQFKAAFDQVKSLVGLPHRHGLLSPAWVLLAERSPKLELADVELRLASRQQEMLEALLRVEALEDAGRKGTPEWESAAGLAFTLQRIVAVLEAKRDLLKLSQVVPHKDKKAQTDQEAQRIATRQKLQAATDALEGPLRTQYKPRPAGAYPDKSTGRRLAFARWLAARDNPLTARVAVNHIWLRHFGQALVPSMFDFGRNGQRPTHPALLDWLAAEFVERGWGMKELHRLIVTSSTYRQASTPDADNLARDPENKYLWRMAPRRLEAEAVRDAIFFVAGRLDPRMGGPDIDRNQGLLVPRRSLYFQSAQEKQMEFLKLFDAAAVSECYQRKESIQPQQALALANSELTRQHACLLAKDLLGQVGPDAAAFTTAVFERVLSRPPTAAETAECVAFLEQQVRRYTEDKSDPPAAPGLRARESLVHVLLNHHEFVTVR